jgi:hypothetical protein
MFWVVKLHKMYLAFYLESPKFSKKVFRKWCCTNLFFLSDLADSRRLISINSVQIYTSMWRFN